MKKKHMNWMMLCKLPLGASLWAILFFFIFTACQDDLPYEDTEVMVTFTTRAETTQGDKASSAIVQERMNNLRVIMVRANGDVVDNHVAENITQTIVTFVFKTPIKTGGERFTFYAIANEVGLTPADEGDLDWIKGKENMNGKMDLYKQLVVGTGSAFNAEGTVTPEKYIPQTKYWAVDVPQVLSQTLEPQRLDYAVSKIMLTFDNKKNTDQSLSNIYISGILSNGKGYLFKQNEPSSDYVTYDVGTEKIINFEDVTVSQSSSKTLYYYTYPVDAANISNPTLHATWNGTEYSVELPGVSSLLRGQRLDIVVTLDQGLAVNFSIKDWEENNTNIGSSPNVGGDYAAGDWTDQDIDINGGEDPVEPDVPVVSGDELVIFKSDEGERANYATKIDLCNSDYVNNEDNIGYFAYNNLLCLDLYYHDTKSTITITDAWDGSQKISGNSYSFNEVGRKNLQIPLLESDVAILKQKGMNIWPSNDDGGFTLYKVSIKKVQSN